MPMICGAEYDEQNADRSQKDHVPKACPPNRASRAIGMPCPQVLADQRGGRVAEAPRRQNGEDYDANADGVTCQGRTAEQADNAYEPDPTGLPDQELQNPGERNPNQAPEHVS